MCIGTKKQKKTRKIKKMFKSFARYDRDGNSLLLIDHLDSVGAKCSSSLLSLPSFSHLRVSSLGYLLGYLHDLGKFSPEWQEYLRVSHFRLESDIKRVPHSKYGAYYLIDKFLPSGFDYLALKKRFLIEACSMIIYGHHSGMSDIISFEDSEYFLDRFSSDFRRDSLDTYHSILDILDESFVSKIEQLFCEALDEIDFIFESMLAKNSKIVLQGVPVGYLNSYFWLRTFQGILVDADREDSMESVGDFVIKKSLRSLVDGRPFVKDLIDVFESNLAIKSNTTDPLQCLRADVSSKCLSASSESSGIHCLTVPTGGGKTFASLRYALHHADIHGKDRIIYVIPFTSIISQNVSASRWILGSSSDADEDFILEHHCNYSNENAILSDREHRYFEETWDMPIIFSTCVQFMNTMFSPSNTDARRVSRLNNSVIVFDEVQTIPHKARNLFCSMLNFLKEKFCCEIVLCTATQPLLNDSVNRNSKDHSIPADVDGDIIADYLKLFDDTQRSSVKVLEDSMEVSEIVQLAKDNALIKDVYRDGSIGTGAAMVITNNKFHTLQLFQAAESDKRFDVYHLSTSMYVKHRNEVINEIIEKLKDNRREKPLLLFTTPLIEAGVDIDFGCVIRCMTGLVSIKQSEGRCNRENKKTNSRFFVVEPDALSVKKNPPSLAADIAATRSAWNRYKIDIANNAESYKDELDVKLISFYYNSLYSKNDVKNTFSYPVQKDYNLIDMLSLNAQKKTRKISSILNGSFRTAQKEFQLIDDFSCGAIVECAESKGLIKALKECNNKKEFKKLLRKATSYMITFGNKTRERLDSIGALMPINEDCDIEYLVDGIYHTSYGLGV